MARAPSPLAALTVAAGLVLAGCGSYRVHLRHEALPSSTALDWRDERPSEQRESGAEAPFTVNCAYGAYSLGDDRFSPGRVEVLRSDLARALGAELAGRRLVLRAYTVHLNRADALRHGKAPPQQGLFPGLQPDAAVRGCSADDRQGGYRLEERTTPFSPLVVVIDLELDGRPIHTRWVESAPEEMEPKARASAPEWDAWVSEALRHATEKVVENVRADLAVGQGR